MIQSNVLSISVTTPATGGGQSLFTYASSSSAVTFYINNGQPNTIYCVNTPFGNVSITTDASGNALVNIGPSSGTAKLYLGTFPIGTPVATLSFTS